MKRVILLLVCIVLTTSVSLADVNVLDFGAVPDSTTDNTKAFQTALNDAAKNGETVIVPKGIYRFDGCLTIPEYVSIEGVGRPQPHGNYKMGSTLLVFSGKNDENAAPFMTTGSCATVKGLIFFYPEQTSKEGANPVPYPWTIQAHGQVSILDCNFNNSFNGIDTGTHYNVDNLIRNVRLSAIRRGMYIDRGVHIPRIEDVEIIPPWELREYTKKNLEGFIIGRCDWAYMVNCFVILPNIGFHFIETPLRADETDYKMIIQGNILVLNSGSDLGPLAIKIEKVQDHAGVMFSNCQFMNGIEISEENTGPLKMNNCGFWGTTGTGHIIYNKGKGTVSLTNCHFSTFDDPGINPGFKWDTSIPFFKFTDGTLLMSSCFFQDKVRLLGKVYDNTPVTHILLEENVQSAAIIGNSVDGGKLNIINKSKGDVKIRDNLVE
jgi:hypothetical protein